MITQEYLKKRLSYDPDTGLFTWNRCEGMQNNWNALYALKQAGFVHPTGYVIINIDDRPYRAHRLAWLYMTGSWPTNQIDHINHIRSANWWLNLRDVSQLENTRNSSISSNNSSGATGVCWHKDMQKWMVYIMVNSKNIYLGYFEYFIIACAIRKEAELDHGFHENHGGVG